MRNYLKGVLTVAAILVLTASVAVAQETTGSINGTVTDETGTAIAGAAVTADGPLGKVSTTTDADGFYRFPRVAPGSYKLMASFVGYTGAESAEVHVVLGQAVTVNFGLQKSTFTEEITVYSDTVVIDFTESQVETSIREWEIDYLPRGRDFTDVVGFAAGTTENNQAGGISVDGASGLENRYVIDGIDTTDPEDGTSAVPMRAEMMEEVQVKSAGYAAEYGGALGGVINAVTRSGSNDWHGSLFADYEDNSWNGSARPEVERLGPNGADLFTFEKDDETRLDPGFVLGGPILRDRWWFFASYQPGIRTTKRTIDWPSYPPDTYQQDFNIDYISANTTANISSALLLKAGLNFSPYTTEGLLPNRNAQADLPGQENYAPLGIDGERETYYLTADWLPSDDFVVSGRAGFYHTNVIDTGVPVFDLIHNYSTSSLAGFVDRHPDIPPAYQQGAGWVSDNFQSGVNQENIYERTAGGIDGTWYLDAAGDHAIKFGYQIEEIYNSVNSGYNADRILYYWDRSHTATDGTVHQGEYGNFRLLRISTFGEAKTQNQGIFVQDSWSVLSNLTLNIGLRFENEAVPNYGATGPDPAISFGWGDKFAPRLGFAWDVMNNAKWKVYGSYGTYYDVTKYAMPRGSFGGDKWVDYWFTFDNPDISLNSYAGGCTVGNNTIFDVPVCGAGTLYDVSDRRLNSADPATWETLGYPTIDPNMKPMESWEAQIGVEHQLTSDIRVGARVVHKQIVRTIEDVGLLYPGVGEVYIISNPGEGVTEGYDLPYVKPRREYDALELSFDKRFADNWSLRAYYTLSRLWGNYSGLANSDEINSFGNPLSPTTTGGRRDPNVSRLWDVAGSAYDENGNPVLGNLATNRTHQLGAQFLYNFPIGLSVGVNEYIGSGTPLSTMGSIPSNNAFYPYGRGDLGTTPWLTQTDLALYYTLGLGGNMNLTFGATILNLFDEDTATRKWTHRTLSDISVTDEDFLTGFDYAAAEAALGAGELDPAYGLWDTFQLPREIRLTVKFEF